MTTRTKQRDAGCTDASSPGSGWPEGPGARCFRCDERPGTKYRADVFLLPGRRREGATVMLEALLGGSTPYLCPGCARVAAIYGQVMGWALEPAQGDGAETGGTVPRSRAGKAA